MTDARIDPEEPPGSRKADPLPAWAATAIALAASAALLAVLAAITWRALRWGFGL